ncbi:hypothetical protein BDZ94DRAFT_1266489 [Collybia nuda]|uniref:Uncharacterized protein n=1 Tax=Collybia nuda TaxID=64659 RepID=A0A9P5Y123_9AGAR|nr:hypothetical protein BDZ94DRAFT_1266489 [Collybia nuda]
MWKGKLSLSSSRLATDIHRQIVEPQRRHSDGDRSPNNDVPPLRNVTPHMSQSVPDRSFRTPAPNEPHRRFSDGDQTAPPFASGSALVLSRNVRWNENLVCPSPIFASQRRKGWYNRRGDQLWTNEGSYKPLPQDQQYPPDLDGYPEFGEGWMNEEGVRIDMQHRLIPKQPLRSALKQTRAHHLQPNATVPST